MMKTFLVAGIAVVAGVGLIAAGMNVNAVRVRLFRLPPVA